jgi:hypothetical protein
MNGHNSTMLKMWEKHVRVVSVRAFHKIYYVSLTAARESVQERSHCPYICLNFYLFRNRNTRYRIVFDCYMWF